MKSRRRANSRRHRRFALFLLFARFAYDWRVHHGLGMKPLSASRCFSAWLWWSRWGAQLRQKGGHGSSHLSQRQHRATMLPGSVHPLDQRTGQHQLVVRTGQHLGPAFGLLRGAQTWLIPEQLLLVEPIAMLLRVAQPIVLADLGQGSGLLPLPDKPADAEVTTTFAGPLTDELDHAHLHRARAAPPCVPSREEATRWLSNTTVPWPASVGRSTTLLIPQAGHTTWVPSGTWGKGTNVRSTAVSASRRYKLLVSTPRKTYSPGSGSGANWTKIWRSCSASIWPSSKASYRLDQRRWNNGESDNSGKL